MQTSGACQNLRHLDATTNQTTNENIYTYHGKLHYINNVTSQQNKTSTIEYIIHSELK